MLEIEAGTGASVDNKAVTLIEIRETSAPPLPGNVRLVGKAFEFKPSGTAFDKPIRMTLGYNVDELPAGVTSVGAAYYTTGSGWVYLSPDTSSVAELGKLTAQVNHFTVFAVLATVTETPVSGLTPASFKLNNLKITPSVSRIFNRVPFVIITGKDVNINVDITNNGEESGVYTAILKINGENRQTKQLTIKPGETWTVTFETAVEKHGTYLIQIGDLTGDFISVIWINWWLLAALIAVIVLICWLVIRIRKRRYNQS
jgi:hypothetical protein